MTQGKWPLSTAKPNSQSKAADNSAAFNIRNLNWFRSSASTAPPPAQSAGFSIFFGIGSSFALQLLARKLARAAHRFRLLAGLLFRWLFKMSAQLHFAENALTLHLFLEDFQGLIDIVVTDYDLQVLPRIWSKLNWFETKPPLGVPKSGRGVPQPVIPVEGSAHLYGPFCARAGPQPCRKNEPLYEQMPHMPPNYRSHGPKYYA